MADPAEEIVGQVAACFPTPGGFLEAVAHAVEQGEVAAAQLVAHAPLGAPAHVEHSGTNSRSGWCSTTLRAFETEGRHSSLDRSDMVSSRWLAFAARHRLRENKSTTLSVLAKSGMH